MSKPCVPNPKKKAVTAPTFISEEGTIHTYQEGKFAVIFNKPVVRKVYLEYPPEDTTIVYSGSDQTITGAYTFTQPASGPAPTDPQNYATKAYVDAVAGGGVPDEYIAKGSALVSTTGPAATAATLLLANGAYSVELKAVLVSGADSATLYQDFMATVGPYSSTASSADFAGSPALSAAEFQVSNNVGGLRIRCAGVTATWKVVYKVMYQS